MGIWWERLSAMGKVVERGLSLKFKRLPVLCYISRVSSG
jgi:hypothetical protein